MKKSPQSPNAAPSGPSILVTGDLVMDHHLYEGERLQPSAAKQRGVREISEPGGVACLHRLLAELFQNFKASREAERKKAEDDFNIATLTAEYWQKRGMKVDDPVKRDIPILAEESWEAVLAINGEANAHHAYAVWKPTLISQSVTDLKKAKPSDFVWRTRLVMGYGGGEADNKTPGVVPIPVPRRKTATAAFDGSVPILVLDDAGLHRRSEASAPEWPLPAHPEDWPNIIVLKIAGPPAQGPLWGRLKQRVGNLALLDRTVVIVSAEELRAEYVGITRGLSWERTVEEVCVALREHPRLSELTRARHLIVTFSIDGALWLERKEGGNSAAWEARLFFDSGRAEGEWRQAMDGRAFGYLNCLVTAVVQGLAQQLPPAVTKQGGSPVSKVKLDASIRAGLSAMRNLHEFGHGQLDDAKSAAGYPVERLAAAIRKPTHDFACSPVPWPLPKASDGRNSWSIVEMSQQPLWAAARRPGIRSPGLTGLARQIVMRGLTALKDLPHAQFGQLTTADRTEMEALRSLRQLMLAYREERAATKPLSIGVFGPPGAGKSFGVKQISNGVLGEKAWLEFNLSQFNGPEDVIGALHQVRDRVLTGPTPVVFWDEFDSREYLWLQYLLAPMQDGKFQERQITHPIGKCVFIFAGGTSPTYEDFGPWPRPKSGGRKETELWRKFRLAKGPDFHSRLDAYYNVLGPNHRVLPGTDNPDPNDFCAPLRRAVFITSHLKVPKDRPLDIDPGLVTALLEVGQYVHGSRSLEKLLTSLKSGATAAIRRSALPAPDLLAMHVRPVEQFRQLCEYEAQAIALPDIDLLAAAIHENYLRTVKQRPPNPAFAKSFKSLSPPEMETNRAAARRIPEILALASLKIVKGAFPDAARRRIHEHLMHHRELLAEAEHRGWIEERAAAGWTYAPVRDNQRLRHNLMVPYSDLPPHEKEKDRDSVQNFPEVLALAGYKIVFA